MQGASQLQQQYMIQSLADQKLKTKLIHSGNMKNNLIKSTDTPSQKSMALYTITLNYQSIIVHKHVTFFILFLDAFFFFLILSYLSFFLFFWGGSLLALYALPSKSSYRPFYTPTPPPPTPPPPPPPHFPLPYSLFVFFPLSSSAVVTPRVASQRTLQVLKTPRSHRKRSQPLSPVGERKGR